MTNRVKVEVVNAGIYDLPENIGDLINRFCGIRHNIPEEHREMATVEFNYGDCGGDFTVSYWRDKTPEELKIEAEYAASIRANRIRMLEAELARLR